MRWKSFAVAAAAVLAVPLSAQAAGTPNAHWFAGSVASAGSGSVSVNVLWTGKHDTQLKGTTVTVGIDSSTEIVYGKHQSSIDPGDHGGNQDTKYVCPGSTVFFPVFHPGALLFMGDCHQIQGDGELCGVAPETDAEVSIRLDVVKGKTIRRPRILTAQRFMTLASAKTLEDAVKLCVRDAVDLLVEEKGLTADEAYLLITVKADIEICQVVDPLMTVRLAMDREFFESLPNILTGGVREEA